MGECPIGELTFESAAYVARYCLKKVTGKPALEHYAGRAPEYVTMSRRPGIGAGWISQYLGETYLSDSVVMRGKEMMPPPFYDRLLEKADPALYGSIKAARELEGRIDESDLHEVREHSRVRLRVKEKVKSETIKHTLKRKFDG